MQGYKHGFSRSKVYQAWESAKSRCNKITHPEYCRYGAKGINICDEWINNPAGWCEFLGNPPDNNHKWSVERIDGALGYAPGNVKWELPDKQARNRKMVSCNTSGVNGVSWRSEGGWLAACARWNDLDGKRRYKIFTVAKFGLLPAFKMAREYRSKMIEQLNTQGAGYSDSHGK